MFGGDDEPSFVEETRNIPPRNNGPVVQNGLFGGNALKEEENDKPTKSKLNSIFDYGDSDEEQKH